MGDSTIDTLRVSIGADVERFRSNAVVIRAGSDEEAVHEARVATRRLRSQLRTFAPALRRPNIQELGTELRWLGRRLGAVRDLDVLASRFENADERAWKLEEEARRLVGLRLATERQLAFAQLVLALSSRRCGSLSRQLDDLASRPPVRSRFAKRPATDMLLPQAARRWHVLERAVGRLGETPADASLHRVRILAKQARYAAEVVEPIGPRDVGRLARRLAQVQKVLGELNDGARAVGWLEESKRSPWTVAAGGVDPIVAVELLLADQHVAMARCRSEWRESFEVAAETARALRWSDQLTV